METKEYFYVMAVWYMGCYKFKLTPSVIKSVVESSGRKMPHPEKKLEKSSGRNP